MGDNTSSAKRIGELNGPWAVLLKVVLAVMPIFVPVLLAWGVWVTTQIFNLEADGRVSRQIMSQIEVHSVALTRHEKTLIELAESNARGGRFTADMAENQRLKIMQETTNMVADKFEYLRKDMTNIQMSITRLTMLIEQRQEKLAMDSKTP